MQLSSHTLIDYIQQSDKENAEKALIEYGNHRAEKAIEESWKKFRRVLAHVNGKNKKKIKDHILNYEENGAIDTLEFVKFIAALYDSLVLDPSKYSEEVIDFASGVADFIDLKLGSIRIDRRMIFGG